MSPIPRSRQAPAPARQGGSDAHYLDELTGLPNRRMLTYFLERQFAAARRGRALSIVLFGVEGHLAYAERHGQEAADRLLRRLAGAMERTTRLMDVCGRLGALEFLVIIAGEARESGEIVARRALRALADELAGLADPVVVRAGVATCERGMVDVDDLVAAAEDALRAATLPGADPVQHALPLARAAAWLAEAGAGEPPPADADDALDAPDAGPRPGKAGSPAGSPPRADADRGGHAGGGRRSRRRRGRRRR